MTGFKPPLEPGFDATFASRSGGARQKTKPFRLSPRLPAAVAESPIIPILCIPVHFRSLT
jgi:hypothetical protein